MVCSEYPAPESRVQLSGKFFRLSGGGEKFYVKGFSYGPFAPNRDGEALPERVQVQRDFAHMRELGANTIRVYFPPPVWLLDEALAHGLFVFIDIPWEKHRCFFEDWYALERARDRVRETARQLGNHPAVFALSVVNEFPVDVVRFYGRKRIERFVEELLAIAKSQAPDCLVTFVNYPTTEFLEVQGCDFACFNVYLHDEDDFGKYLDRLQHIAGNKPLVLGEYGIDSQREGAIEQAALLSRHLKQVFRHGLAGSVVFAFTDDWFTGGHQIDDWFFGVTHADRSDKLAAAALHRVWKQLPAAIHQTHHLPKVSVVVCSYNGARTLRGCLASLMSLDYPNYEVILVDDGSRDATAQIAAEFPQVIYHHQENKGLSVARNVGANLAGGEIVAYTDDDCVVDVHWLRYLVHAMRDPQVAAVGGPNLPPPTDSWIAKCVAASPGGPSHVMLDDRYAEHVPGCNMAFYRSELLALGGFDPQFRQAGDDVDVCWRLIDAGKKIGFAPGAMVWHHRRSSVRAYIKQQQGYGRSEAMVHFKHPRRFDALGKSNWKGVIYGDGAVGLPVLPPLIYHGPMGAAPFQTIYRQNRYGLAAWFTTIEWHLVALFILALGSMFPPLALLSLLMWSATVWASVRAALDAPLQSGAPWWCRPLISWLYFVQPIARGWTRHTHLLRERKLPLCDGARERIDSKRISPTQRDIYWDDHQARGREQLLAALSAAALRTKWSSDFEDSWSDNDIKLVGDRWHEIAIRTATENLGWPRRFTRARCSVSPTLFTYVVVVGSTIWTLAGLVSLRSWPLLLALPLMLYWLVCLTLSRRRCLAAATEFVARAGKAAGLGGAAERDAADTLTEVFSIGQDDTTDSVAESPVATLARE
jgi:cellulose synthase/poly-beta-1,6-N-acetylglucosamine synthase-like glycosyltransferase